MFAPSEGGHKRCEDTCGPGHAALRDGFPWHRSQEPHLDLFDPLLGRAFSVGGEPDALAAAQRVIAG